MNILGSIGDNKSIVPKEYITSAAAPNYGKGVNLLDNWYFVGGGSQQGGGQFPINQRGQTSYTGAGYGIDRWISTNAGIVVKVESDCITIENTGLTSYVGIMQRMTSNVWDALGTNAVGSMLVKRISGNASLFLNGDTARGLVAGLNFISPVNENAINQFALVVQPGASISIIAAKLELGSEQTLAHQDSSGNWVLNDTPDYGDELRECQRYYLPQSKPTQWVVAEYVSGSGLIQTIPAHLRIAPNYSSITNKAYIGNEWVDIASIGVYVHPTCVQIMYGFISGANYGPVLLDHIPELDANLY